MERAVDISVTKELQMTPKERCPRGGGGEANVGQPHPRMFGASASLSNCTLEHTCAKQLSNSFVGVTKIVEVSSVQHT